MKLTENKPTEPGYYWLQPYGGVCHIVVVRLVLDKLVVYENCEGDSLDSAYYDDASWAGPIPEPEPCE